MRRVWLKGEVSGPSLRRVSDARYIDFVADDLNSWLDGFWSGGERDSSGFTVLLTLNSREFGRGRFGAVFSFKSLIASALAVSAHAAPRNTAYPVLETTMPSRRPARSSSAVDFFKQTAPSNLLIVAAKDDDALKHTRTFY